MNAVWEKIKDRFDAFSFRERVLITVAIMVVGYVLWYMVLYDYILATNEEIAQKAKQIQEQISGLEGQIDTISGLLGRNPTYVLVKQARDLKQENVELGEKIKVAYKTMVSSKEMVEIVHDLIKKTGNLTILDIESQETQPLFSAKAIEENGKVKKIQAFRHGLKIEIIGEYFEIATFLKALRAKELNVIWDELSYEVVKYPKAKVILVLHTLSLEEGWMGV